MTHQESIQELYLQAKRERGEDALSTIMLKRQLDFYKRRGSASTGALFQIGSQARDHDSDTHPRRQ
jgi:hypothetical protein